MSIDCYLDVLAPSPQEINDIAAALLEPSREFLVRTIEREQKIDEVQTSYRRSLPRMEKSRRYEKRWLSGRSGVGMSFTNRTRLAAL
jgi:hypothetical protein